MSRGARDTACKANFARKPASRSSTCGDPTGSEEHDDFRSNLDVVAVASHSISRVGATPQQKSVNGFRAFAIQPPPANVGNGKFGTRTESHAGRLISGVARKALVRALRSVGLSARAARAVA